MTAFPLFLVRLLSRPAVRLSDLECNSLSEFSRIAAHLSLWSNSAAEDGSVCSGKVSGMSEAHRTIFISTRRCARARWRTDRLGASQKAVPFQPTLCTNLLRRILFFHFLLFSAEQLLPLAKGTFCNKGKTTRRRHFVSRPRNLLQYLDRLAAIPVIAKS
jgi:hypothetical protein